MNRTIALFVALVILLAHCLAIFTDGQGHFAFPYDQSFVALRLAQNLVIEGQLRWNPGSTAWESYPSPLWVAVAAFVERLAATRIGDALDLSVNTLIQAASIVSALLCVVLAAGFRRDRVAGLIAPLLLVTCGSFAAAAASGVETAVFALLVTASFLSFERRYENRLAIATTLLCLVRPEGAFAVAGLVLLRHVGFARGEERPRLLAFLAPLVTVTATTLVRHHETGWYLPPSLHALLHPLPGQAGEGFEALSDSLRTAISLVLLVYTIVSLARRRLSGTGVRALLLAGLLAVVAGLAGRGPLPFAEALVPVLPLAFVAVQEGLIEALDGTSVLARRLALSSLFACLFVTALVSRHPADLGPLPLEGWHEQWMRTRGSARFGYEQPLGRLGLEEEIDTTNRLRGVGLFLRDYLDPGATVLTPWPGSVGYLSRLRTIDVQGRASSVAGRGRPAPWNRRGRADVVAALGMRPDYVLHETAPGEEGASLVRVARTWVGELDDRPETDGRLAAVEKALAAYECITIPILIDPRGSAPPRREPFRLLRRRDLGLRPRLDLQLSGREYTVRVVHRTHLQVADLHLVAIDAASRPWSVRPTGELTPGPEAIARPGMLLHNSGARPIQAIRGSLPAAVDGSPIVELRAVLRNPDGRGEDEFQDVSATATASL